MKTTQLIITWLISTTVCVQAKYSLAFFANFKGTYLPLSIENYVFDSAEDPDDTGRCELRYDKYTNSSTAMSIKNNQAFIDDNIHSNWSISVEGEDVFVDRYSEPMTFDIGENMEVKYMRVRYCETKVSKIYFTIFGEGNWDIPDDWICEDAKVYILPYNSTTRTFVQNVFFDKSIGGFVNYTPNANSSKYSVTGSF